MAIARVPGPGYAHMYLIAAVCFIFWGNAMLMIYIGELVVETVIYIKHSPRVFPANLPLHQLEAYILKCH